MTTLLAMLAAGLTAAKAIDDLDAFQPGPIRRTDLLALAVTMLVMVVALVALAGNAGPAHLVVPCIGPSCIVVTLA